MNAQASSRCLSEYGADRKKQDKCNVFIWRKKSLCRKPRYTNRAFCAVSHANRPGEADALAGDFSCRFGATVLVRQNVDWR